MLGLGLGIRETGCSISPNPLTWSEHSSDLMLVNVACLYAEEEEGLL